MKLLIGGSPCQGFSFAGKQLNFDDPRSKLFFEYVRLKEEYKPDYFLLENVKMKKESQDIISSYLGVEPIEINSALVSAQNRKRLYWTNIPGVEQPEDKGILLKDILESGTVDRDKSYCIDANYYKGGSLKNYLEKKRRQIVLKQSEKRLMVKEKPERIGTIGKGGQGQRIYSIKGKSVSLSANGGGQGAKTGLYKIDLIDDYIVRKLTPIECERLQTVPDNYTKKLEEKCYLLYNKEEINIKGEILCSAKLKDVTERQQHINMENSVFYITKGIKDMGKQSFLKENITPIKNVNIVIERLGKKVAEQEECVIDITRIGLGTATRYIQTKLDYQMVQEDIKKELMVKIGTESFLKITLEENLKEMKSYIISILIKLIIELKIYSYVMDKANIHFCIDSLSQSQGNLLRVELSDLRMENIKYCSNTQRYKMLGNGWTVDVIAHIFNNLPDAEYEVLSLFDGMSCGQLALQRAGINFKKYMASEVDKYAIQVTQKNFPNTIQLGDVISVMFVDSFQDSLFY